jgi:PAS domain S-box-containing protein
MQPLDDSALRHVIDAFTGNLIITDPKQEGNPIVYASYGYQQLCGYTLEEIIGKNPNFLHGPETSEQHKMAFRALIKQKRPGKVTLVNYRKDGSKFWNEVNICPILNDAGEVDYWIASHRDASDDITKKQTYLDQLTALKNNA